jgi:hypothetical protein
VAEPRALTYAPMREPQEKPLHDRSRSCEQDPSRAERSGREGKVDAPLRGLHRSRLPGRPHGALVGVRRQGSARGGDRRYPPGEPSAPGPARRRS